MSEVSGEEIFYAGEIETSEAVRKLFGIDPNDVKGEIEVAGKFLEGLSKEEEKLFAIIAGSLATLDEKGPYVARSWVFAGFFLGVIWEWKRQKDIRWLEQSLYRETGS